MKAHMKTLKPPILILAALALSLGAGSVAASTLIMIPPLAGDNDSQGRAITPDGQYVAGLSGTRGILYPVGAADAINVLSADGAQATVANGIGYRTSGGNPELIVCGLTSSGPAEFMTTNGGTTWANKRRNTLLSANTMGTANQLGATIASDIYYVSSSRDATSQPIYLTQLSNTWVALANESAKGLASTDRGIMYGVSSIGRAVGRRGAGGSSYGAYVLDFASGTPTAYYINTLNDGQNGGTTTLGELWSVSQDGTAVFGRSWLTGNSTSSDYHAFKTTLSGFGPGTTQGAVNQLPEYPDTGGSVGRAVPYGCSANGRYVVGQNFRSAERAVLWDTGDANPANWTVTDLTDLATSEGILGGFTRLTRAYSIGFDGSGNPVITGYGDYFDGSATWTRGFVMTVTLSSAPAPQQPRITSITGAGTGIVTINYTNTLVGTNYVVQYRTNLSTTNWTSLAPVPAAGTSSSTIDTPPANDPQRYYRVYYEYTP
jgi:hypothetical protein